MSYASASCLKGVSHAQNNFRVEHALEIVAKIVGVFVRRPVFYHVSVLRRCA